MGWFRRRRSHPAPQDEAARPPTGPARFPDGAPHRRRLGDRELPPVAVPSQTASIIKRNVAPYLLGSGRMVQIRARYEDLNHRTGAPVHLGVGGRAAILLCLSPEQRADLRGLDEHLTTEGAVLYVQAHRLDRYGMLRLVLALAPGLVFRTPLTLAHGDVQEFLIAAHAHESVELHVSHQNRQRLPAFVCTAGGLRGHVERALDVIGDLDHPAGPHEQAGPLGKLAALYPGVLDGVEDGSAVPLRVGHRGEDTVLVTAT
ncbi:hypothetical protein [Streptomyces marincola]|uniref:hypothetical protein n=1 Tax=Streptomyces marincola TaxID=2878388 RepID=UPI00131DFE7E|nr:hypothetical protein [Streptomyces marincola]